jgi:hypothetical protein
MANTRAAITDIKTNNPKNINSKAAIGVVLTCATIADGKHLTIAKGIPISIVTLPFFSSELNLSLGLSE